MDGDDVEARLEAVERALADGDTDLSAVGEAAEHGRELGELKERVDELESQVTDLAAGVQAVRGYVGNVRTVNRDVERRADAALSKVEELERHRAGLDGRHTHAGTDSGTRADSDPGERAMQGRQTSDRSESGERNGERAETPGDIARRITGRDGSRRGGGGHQRSGTERRSRPRDWGGGGSGDGAGAGPEERDDGGFLSGLRDAL
jgi:hypothetical protein